MSNYRRVFPFSIKKKVARIPYSHKSEYSNCIPPMLLLLLIINIPTFAHVFETRFCSAFQHHLGHKLARCCMAILTTEYLARILAYTYIYIYLLYITCNTYIYIYTIIIQVICICVYIQDNMVCICIYTCK